MVIFLHGEDDFLVGRRKRSLVHAFQKKYPASEVFVFDFEDQGSPENVRRALGSAEGGLFAVEKMLVFLHPFALGEGGEKALGEFLKKQKKGSEEKTILLFVHFGKIKKTHPVTSVLLKVADKEEVLDRMQGRDEINFIKKELKEYNSEVEFSSQALQVFLALTTGNSARRVTEIEKLATYKEKGVIEMEDIDLLIESPEESAIFTALDALGRGEKGQALTLFHHEAKKSEGIYPVLSMCAWQVRRLLVVREAYDNGVRRPGDIASGTKLPPFVVQKMLGSIQNFPLERMKKGLALLSELDTDLKRGKKDPSVALDLFIWKF